MFVAPFVYLCCVLTFIIERYKRKLHMRKEGRRTRDVVAQTETARTRMYDANAMELRKSSNSTIDSVLSEHMNLYTRNIIHRRPSERQAEKWLTTSIILIFLVVLLVS